MLTFQARRGGPHLLCRHGVEGLGDEVGALFDGQRLDWVQPLKPIDSATDHVLVPCDFILSKPAIVLEMLNQFATIVEQLARRL